MGPEVFIFMVSMNCQLDFDHDFWFDFDAAMMHEWNITAITGCHGVESFPSSIYAYKNLASRIIAQDENSTVVAGKASDFTAYIDALLDQNRRNIQLEQVVFLTKHSDKIFQKPLASVVAYQTENMAFAENNFEYSTAATSHEILHLVLEAERHEKSCYVDAVHESQFKYELNEMGKNKHPIIKKFDC